MRRLRAVNWKSEEKALLFDNTSVVRYNGQLTWRIRATHTHTHTHTHPGVFLSTRQQCFCLTSELISCKLYEMSGRIHCEFKGIYSKLASWMSTNASAWKLEGIRSDTAVVVTVLVFPKHLNLTSKQKNKETRSAICLHANDTLKTEAERQQR